jgi:lysophospholipase L1-like esterase
MKTTKLSKRSKIKDFFAIILVAILFFGLIEFTLRLIGFGNNLSLLLNKEIRNKKYLMANPHFCSKYFPNYTASMPAIVSQLFVGQKPDNVFRIYIIGESTSKGFPYSRTESFPYQLEQMLNNAKTQYRFEVINFSMAATNSHIGLDVVKELTRYPPDLAIIYYGHNEFIGIGGSGSYHHPFFRLNKNLSHLRLYQSLKLTATKTSKQDPRILLERMAEKKGVEYNSRVYKNTMNDFEINYGEILNLLTSKNVAVITCGVVKNVKEFKPLESKGKITDTEIEKITENIKSENDSLPIIQRLNEKIKDNAEASHAAAEVLLELQKNKLAKYFYYQACDLDMLRLRAPSDINKIIECLSIKYNCNYIDLQELINNMDKDGIAGNDLILDHVHPSLDCQTAIAEKLAATIFDNILKVNIPENYQKIEIQSSFIEKMAVAKLLANIFSNYPFDRNKYFNKKGFEPVYNTNYKNFSEFTLKEGIDKNTYKILNQYFSKHKKIDEIHVKYGLDLCRNGKFDRAYNEFLLAFLQNPINIVALNNMAAIKFSAGDIINALKMQHEVFELAPFYRTGVMNLWYMYKVTNKLEKAKEFEPQLRELKIKKDDISHLVFDDLGFSFLQ